MAASRAHVPCTSCVRASCAPPLHLYMVCKSRMQTCTCAACASASSAQNAVDAGVGAHTRTHYSPSVQVSPVYEVIVQSHLPIGRRHRPLLAQDCSASEQTGGKKTPPGKGPLVVVTLVGDPWGTLGDPCGTLGGPCGDPWGPLGTLCFYPIS